MAKFLFVTDLDDTLVYRTVGDDSALAELNQLLSQHRQEYGTKIVYLPGDRLYFTKNSKLKKIFCNQMHSSFL